MTATHVERELKLKLRDEQAWAELRRALGPPQAVKAQINTYLDTPDRRLLKTRALMVRVRDEDGVLKVQAKDRVDGSGGLLVARERSAELSVEAWRRVHRGECGLDQVGHGLGRALGEEAGGHLLPVGAVTNRREEYALGQGYVLELDRTVFPGGRVDYEVEIELRQPEHSVEGARAAFEAATGQPAGGLGEGETKYARLLAALEALEDPERRDLHTELEGG